MNKKLQLTLLIVILIGLGTYFLFEQKQESSPTPTTGTPLTFDPENATYIIEGQPVTLINGRAEVETAPGSAIKIITTVFGEPVSGDLNGDGMADDAIILIQNQGGSGTFYYISVALNMHGTTQGTNAILLGDRIAPQNISIKNRQVLVNYADRNPREPMTTPPSLGVTKYLVVQNGTLQTSTPIAGPGEHCGGNIATAPTCSTGYHCAPNPDSHLPFGDIGGSCTPN